MIFKEDITKRIETDFAASAEEASAMLVAALEKTEDLKTDRIIRCIIFLATGDLAELKKIIQMATADPRDVMFAAEYRDGDDKHNYIRIRDFNQTFDKCEENVNP